MGAYDPSSQYPLLPLPRADVEGSAGPASNVVVVGAGSSGALAGYLLGRALPERRVIVLDAGSAYEQANPYMSGWLYNWGTHGRAVESKCMDGSPYPITPTFHQGVGGAGSHNTAIAFMIGDEQFDTFAGALGLTQQELKIATQAVLNMEPLSPAIQDGESPWFDRCFAAIGRHAGMRSTPGPDFEGRIQRNTVGFASMGAYPVREKRDALRWCPALLLHPLLRPKNVTVAPGVEVERIVWAHEDGPNILRLWRRLTRAPLTASSLLVRKDGKYYRIRLGDALLANGALRVPELLQRSGVGPQAVLRAAGITPVIINELVGSGVDHSEIAVQVNLPDTQAEVPWGGPMDWPAVGFLETGEAAPPTQFHFSISGPPYTSNKVAVLTRNISDPEFDKGYRVRIHGPALGSGFGVDFFPMGERDRRVLREGVRKVMGVVGALQAEGLVAAVEEPTADIVVDDAKLDSWIAAGLGTAFHWMGDARAGTSPDSSVADEHFALRNGAGTVSNVWITSTAAFPASPWANVHVTVQVFAVLAARAMHQALRGQTAPDFEEWRVAAEDIGNNKGVLQVRRPGEERPDARMAAEDYGARWDAVSR
jgi:choline dehydrogenase-like flavoprotein